MATNLTHWPLWWTKDHAVWFLHDTKAALRLQTDSNLQKTVFSCGFSFITSCFFFLGKDKKSLKDKQTPSPLSAFLYVHVVYPHTCPLHLPLLSETLRCAMSLTGCFRNTVTSLSRSHPRDLGYIERGADLFSIWWRAPFHDLSNFQLTPLKVSYDLVETDYGDNSITHNHVGSPNSRQQIEFELHCLELLMTCRFLLVMCAFVWVCVEFWWSRGAHIWSGLVSGPRWCSWGSLL